MSAHDGASDAINSLGRAAASCSMARCHFQKNELTLSPSYGNENSANVSRSRKPKLKQLASSSFAGCLLSRCLTSQVTVDGPRNHHHEVLHLLSQVYRH